MALPAIPAEHALDFPRCGCRDLPEHILMVQAVAAKAAHDRLARQLAEAHRESSELERWLDEEIGNRDALEERLDEFAYAVAPMEVIGEHSSGNCPWRNALDLILERGLAE